MSSEDPQSLLKQIRQRPHREEFYILCFLLTASDNAAKQLAESDIVPEGLWNWRDDMNGVQKLSPTTRSSIRELAEYLDDKHGQLTLGDADAQKRKMFEHIGEKVSDFTREHGDLATHILFRILQSTPDLWHYYYDLFPHAGPVSPRERLRIMQALIFMSSSNKTLAEMEPSNRNRKITTYLDDVKKQLSGRGRLLLFNLLSSQEDYIFATHTDSRPP